MQSRYQVVFELDGLDGLAETCEEIAGHIDAALQLIAQLQGEHVLTPRFVTRPAERTSSRNAGASSEGGAS